MLGCSPRLIWPVRQIRQRCLLFFLQRKSGLLLRFQILNIRRAAGRRRWQMEQWLYNSCRTNRRISMNRFFLSEMFRILPGGRRKRFKLSPHVSFASCFPQKRLKRPSSRAASFMTKAMLHQASRVFKLWLMMVFNTIIVVYKPKLLGFVFPEGRFGTKWLSVGGARASIAREQKVL